MYLVSPCARALVVSVCTCVHDGVWDSKLIGHMSAQMSSLFNKAADLNCDYCQHLTVALPARWYLAIYHSDEPSRFTLYSSQDHPVQIRKCFTFQLNSLKAPNHVSFWTLLTNSFLFNKFKHKSSIYLSCTGSCIMNWGNVSKCRHFYVTQADFHPHIGWLHRIRLLTTQDHWWKCQACLLMAGPSHMRSGARGAN